MISTPNERELVVEEEHVYRPCPTRIALMCAVIRRKWTAREYRRRSVHPTRRWTVPTVAVDLERVEISAE